MNDLFAEIGVIVIVATACAIFARLIKQPPLFGYIVAGIILGPLGVSSIHNQELLEAMRQMGVSLLLFLVGIELDWNKARHHTKAVLSIGIIQVIASFIIGFFLAFMANLGATAGIYIGLALAFSSTVIVVKLLSEMRDLNSLHGRLAVGILFVQDIAAILALVVVSGITGESNLSIADQLFLLVAKTLALLVIVWAFGRYVLPPLFARLAKSTEILFLASVAWCFIFTLVMYRFDFPIEIGAFLAGISLAALPYSLDIMNRLRSLRDFFVILLFVSLGSSLVLPSLPYFMLTLSFLILTVLAKPLTTFFALAANGYRSRTAFMAAITQGQLSEFSLIIVAIGLHSGHISNELASSIAFSAVIAILISTFVITHRNRIYRPLRKVLRLAERGHRHQEQLTAEMEERLHDHVIIFGYHRMGYHVLKKLRQMRFRAVVVDFNPDIVRSLRSQQVDCVYGDVEDEEIFDHVQVKNAKMVISTIPHPEETTFMIERVRKLNKHVQLIVTAHSVDDALHYYKLGADYVIMPHLLGGDRVAELIIDQEHHSLEKAMKHHQEELQLLKTKQQGLYYD